MALQENQPLITVFTPTYNREHLLPDLYTSLKQQSCKLFEWVIVDDGSSDNTKQLVSGWIEEKRLDIYYFYKENGGKHRAINQGVKKARGELFFIVDSDDSLTHDAIESIVREWSLISDKSKIAGLCFRKVHAITKQILGKKFPLDRADATSLQISYEWNITQDKAEIFLTRLLLQYPFPEFVSEIFLTEAIVWNRIAQSATPYLRCVDQGIYMCEYLQDGLTANKITLLKKNPKGYLLYYKSILCLFYVWKRPIALAKTIIRYLQCVYYNISR